MFRVELPNKPVVLTHISGKLRKNFIKLILLTQSDIHSFQVAKHEVFLGRICLPGGKL
jgi:translation initiation factor IF-1